MNRELPVHTIEGTDFIVDVENLQLVEKTNPKNTIKIFEMVDVGDGYEFQYSKKLKTTPIYINDDSIVKVKIPQLRDLDPLGMSEKYNCSPDAIQNKTDFDLMVDQQALGRRLLGQLPTIDIVCNTYYVDVVNDTLRPASSVSKEISFTEMAKYFSVEKAGYIIPYNTKTRNLQDVNLDKITSMPENVVTVYIPHEEEMDIVGYNKMLGLELTNGLKQANLKLHSEARLLDWKETFFEEAIRDNVKTQQKHQIQSKQNIENEMPGKRQRKGHKL